MKTNIYQFSDQPVAIVSVDQMLDNQQAQYIRYKVREETGLSKVIVLGRGAHMNFVDFQHHHAKKANRNI